MDESTPNCDQADHHWLATFLESGRLAYWSCEGCGLTDRSTDSLTERLAEYNWSEHLRLRARGELPPTSKRRWMTHEGQTLVEGDHCGVDYLGAAMEGLDEAFDYELHDVEGSVVERYHATCERTSRWGTNVKLTRYAVKGTELVRFEMHGHEESTFDIPIPGKVRSAVVLASLELVGG